MPLLQWEDEFVVGVGLIDRQHLKLVQMLNELHNSLSTRREHEGLERTLSGLIAYTQAHFLSEERLMRQHRYVGYETHHREHEVFTKRVLRYQAEFRDANKSIPLQLTAFLKDWLEHHILQTDKRLGLYLNTCGVR